MRGKRRTSRCAGLARTPLRRGHESGHPRRLEAAVRLMQDQRVDGTGPPAAELDAKTVEPRDGEYATLVRLEHIGRLAGSGEDELSAAAERHLIGRVPMGIAPGAGYTKLPVHAVAGRHPDEDDVLHQRLERDRQAADSAVAVGPEGDLTAAGET